MNETMKTILSRRSVRSFSAQPIHEEILRDVAEAGMHAPSGMCRKTWQFTVVADRRAVRKLASAVAAELDRPAYNMYDPAALVIPSNQRDNPFGKEDNACALQNIFLAAKSYGVGSVWLNQLQGICDRPAVREVLREIGIPDDHVVYGLAALGYADPSAPEPQYREIGEIKYVL